MAIDRAAQDDFACFVSRFCAGELVPGHEPAHRVIGLDREASADAALLDIAAHQPALAARAQRESQRIQENRLAGAGFAGEHVQAGPQFEHHLIDEDDVLDDERRKHWARR